MKYIIDVPDEQRHIYDEEDKVLSFLVINKNSKCNMAIDIEAMPYTEPDRKAIEDAQEEAWKMASKCLWDITNSQSRDIFGTDCVYVPREMSYQEAKARYDDWKKSKDEIRVGDEVLDHLGKPYIIYKINDVSAYGVGFDECPLSHNCFPVCYNKKTGRHFDEVEELLKKMKGESE